ncbi:hypothetical protein GQ457_02G043360 [Hibiscus cannabinus]
MDFHSVFYFIVLHILMFCPILRASNSQESARKPVCGEEVCGNVNISLPFGIKANCYTNTWFRVTCNQTTNGHKPYLHRLKLEYLILYCQLFPPPPPIFVGENYHIWVVKMKTYLQAYDLWEVVEMDRDPPPLRANPTLS